MNPAPTPPRSFFNQAEGRLEVWGQGGEHGPCLGHGRRGLGMPPPALREELLSQVSPLPPGWTEMEWEP